MRINSLEVFTNDEKKDKIIEVALGDSTSYNTNYNLVIGENGSGKSRYLKYIQDIFNYLEKFQANPKKDKCNMSFILSYTIGEDTYLINKKDSETELKRNNEQINIDKIKLPSNVIAVSFLVSDKFLFSKNDKGIYKYIGVREAANNTYTKSVFRKLTRNILIAIQKGRQNDINKVLEQLGFEKNYIKVHFFDIFSEDNEHKKVEKIPSSVNVLRDFVAESKIPVLLDSSKTSYDEVQLKRNGRLVEVSQLSSGELHLLFSMVGILAYIEDDSLILVDEPEISLHPEWQVSYISRIKDLFNKYNSCCFVIASHSHYLVSDMPPENSSVVIFRKDKKNHSYISTEVVPYSTYAWSAENILYNVFGMRTTRNYYFERDLEKLLDAIEDENKLDINIAKEKLIKLKNYVLSNDDPLIDVLEEAEEYINVHA